jgi:hypothetical protein
VSKAKSFSPVCCGPFPELGFPLVVSAGTENGKTQKKKRQKNDLASKNMPSFGHCYPCNLRLNKLFVL